MKHAFTTIPGAMWVITGIVLLAYKLNKTNYNEIVEKLNKRKQSINQ